MNNDQPRPHNTPAVTSAERGLAPSADASNQDGGDFTRIERHEVLEPGRYWRLTKSFGADAVKAYPPAANLVVGDVHLLLNIHIHDDKPHSVDILEHPREGGKNEFTFLIDEFIERFEPVSDEEAQSIRSREQADVMQAMAELQEEMAQAQVNPLSLPGVQQAAEEAVERFEYEEQARIQRETKDAEKRDQDIRRVLRRAARRSSAKGNPLAVRKATISDRVDVMISEGITSDGVRELTLEAGRRVAIAEAASRWLTQRTEHLGRLMKSLTPYFAEKPQVALAKSRDAIKYVKTLSEGIESLKLYTGDGVAVVTLASGADAPTHEPLVLLQGKRYMDQEMAVWAHVEDSFDWRSQEVFFRELLANRSLLDQVLPKPRCVVSMAVTARTVDYGRNAHPYEVMMNEIQNRAVFLLVRNGENVHVVYSSEPSHEAAKRLFPTRAESDGPFQGVDGTKIGLNDIRFSKAMAQHDNLALHYKRFLILLCGLDHREQLFGDFYPREEGLKFMSLDFQSRYFRFVQDDDDALVIEGGTRPRLTQWMAQCNSFIRSGSRIVLSGSLSLGEKSRLVRRAASYRIDRDAIPAFLVATVSKGFHRVEVPTYNRYEPSERKKTPIWLDGPDAETDGETWFLCIDRARLADVQAYLYGRRYRTPDISWLRTLRRVEQVLLADVEHEQELRDYLRKCALDNKVLSEDNVDEAVDTAIATWRGDHRGAAAPSVHETAAVNAILTLMYPAGRLVDSIVRMADEFAQTKGERPLRVVRTGSAKLALYTEVPELEKGVLRGAVVWGWVKRYSIVEKRGKLISSSSALTWIERGAQSSAEEVLHDWPELGAWLMEASEAVKPRAVEDYLAAMDRMQYMADVISGKTGAEPGVAPNLDGHDFIDAVDEYRKRVREATYYVSSYFAIPIGVYQRSAKASPVFLYATAPIGAVINTYGSADQKDLFRKVMHSSRASKQEFAVDNPIWQIRGMKKPIGKTLYVPGRGIEEVSLNWLTIETRGKGGVKKPSRSSFSWTDYGTRRKRRESGAKPLLSHESQHKLSLNRAFDTLMGINPELRRRFYKDVKSRVFSVAGVQWDEANTRKGKEERARRYVANIPEAVHLSPLVWSHTKNRGVASKLFRRRPVQT